MPPIDRLVPRRSSYKPVYPWLSPSAIAILNRAAHERGQHPSELAGQILTAVLEENLIAAVLER
jgi:hypothetical protein